MATKAFKVKLITPETELRFGNYLTLKDEGSVKELRSICNVQLLCWNDEEGETPEVVDGCVMRDLSSSWVLTHSPGVIHTDGSMTVQLIEETVTYQHCGYIVDLEEFIRWVADCEGNVLVTLDNRTKKEADNASESN